jgi:hypothetical protein
MQVCTYEHNLDSSSSLILSNVPILFCSALPSHTGPVKGSSRTAARHLGQQGCCPIQSRSHSGSAAAVLRLLSLAHARTSPPLPLYDAHAAFGTNEYRVLSSFVILLFCLRRRWGKFLCLSTCLCSKTIEQFPWPACTHACRYKKNE